MHEYKHVGSAHYLSRRNSLFGRAWIHHERPRFASSVHAVEKRNPTHRKRDRWFADRSFGVWERHIAIGIMGIVHDVEWSDSVWNSVPSEAATNDEKSQLWLIESSCHLMTCRRLTKVTYIQHQLECIFIIQKSTRLSRNSRHANTILFKEISPDWRLKFFGLTNQLVPWFGAGFFRTRLRMDLKQNSVCYLFVNKKYITFLNLYARLWDGSYFVCTPPSNQIILINLKASAKLLDYLMYYIQNRCLWRKQSFSKICRFGVLKGALFWVTHCMH